MSKEATLIEKSQKSHVGRLLVVCFSDNGNEDYEPVIVNESVTDEVSEFILQEEAEIKNRIAELSRKTKSLGKKPKPHRIRRGRHETRQVRDSWTTEGDRLQEKLKVLRGEALRPIRLIMEGERIVGYEFGIFNPTEAAWWDFVRYAREKRPFLLDLPTEDLALVERAFVLRQEWRWDVEGAAEKHQKLVNELEGTDLEVHLKQITTYFSEL